jgi:hypothetical protein
VGIGAAVYAWDKIIKPTEIANLVGSPSISVSPPISQAYPGGKVTAKISWQNPSSSSVQYGVQGDVLVNGQVQGHWWVSDAVNAAALAAYKNSPQTYLQYELAPQNRVAVVTVGPGQTGSVTLVTDLTYPASQETWTFMIQPNYRSGLLVRDPLGTSESAIASAAPSRFVLVIPKVK